MGECCSKRWPEGVSNYELGKRSGKFVILGAGIYSIDWSSDILTVVSYFESRSWMFGTIGISILIVNPILVWLYMVRNDGAPGSTKSYLSFVLPWFVWTKACDAVFTGSTSFEMAFISIAEAPAEAFPQGLLQGYSLMIGIFDEVADKVIFGMPKQILIQVSIGISFVSMAKSMTSFDCYGQKDISWFQWMRQLCHRFAQVVFRVITIALLGALMRQQNVDLHQHVNYWLPGLLVFGFMLNLLIMRYWAPDI